MQKKIIVKAVCFMVGDGRSINIWLDQDYKPKPKDDSLIQVPMMVSSLINPSTKSWCVNRLEELFDVESIEAIKRIQILVRPRQDSLMWIKDHNVLNWQNIWNLKIQERLKMLLWRIGANVLPTKEILHHRMVLKTLIVFFARRAQKQWHICSSTAK